jgi:hypothetical protein
VDWRVYADRKHKFPRQTRQALGGRRHRLQVPPLLRYVVQPLRYHAGGLVNHPSSQTACRWSGIVGC